MNALPRRAPLTEPRHHDVTLLDRTLAGPGADGANPAGVTTAVP